MSRDDGYWFEPKSHGYGAGLPIAPQGWLLIAGYVALMGLTGAFIDWTNAMEVVVGVIILMFATAGLGMIAKARTRGGWRWRWGEKD